jgi:hypothetical protein
MKDIISKYLLAAHGVYYIVTALWAVLFLDSFSLVLGHQPHVALYGFVIQTFGMVLVGLGTIYVLGAMKKLETRTVLLLAAMTSTAIVLMELWYLPKMGFTLFTLDMIQEMGAAILFGYAYLKKH